MRIGSRIIRVPRFNVLLAFGASVAVAKMIISAVMLRNCRRQSLFDGAVRGMNILFSESPVFPILKLHHRLEWVFRAR